MDRPGGVHRSSKPRYLFALLVSILPSAMLREPQTESGGPPAIHITNFGQINQNYYRGGQPTAAGFLELKQLGVKTVVDLREDGIREEPERVRKLGMQYFSIPLSSRRPATAAQTVSFLKLVNDAGNLPVYVHCAGGRHRTSEMTAIYRITHDSWTADQAYQEMKRYGYYSLWGHGSLKEYVYHFYNDYRARSSSRSR